MLATITFSNVCAILLILAIIAGWVIFMAWLRKKLRRNYYKRVIDGLNKELRKRGLPELPENFIEIIMDEREKDNV